jgi:nitroreductase
MFNMNKAAAIAPEKLAWFRDKSFRQACAYAIDRRSIINNVYFGLAVELTGPLSPSNKPWYNPNVRKYEYNLEKARQILNEAGYKDYDGDGVVNSNEYTAGTCPTNASDFLHLTSIAMSGTNMQPWCVHVVAGEAKEKLSRAIVDAFEAGGEEHERTWKYYPDDLFEPYLSRKRAVGWGLYSLLGIGKGDHAQMKAQRAQNFLFFGAPVGMFFTVDDRLEIGSWLDYGMFIQSIMISARSHGLHTCAQAAFADYHRIIRAHLGIPDNHTVICGLSIGYEDRAAAANRLRTERLLSPPGVGIFLTQGWPRSLQPMKKNIMNPSCRRKRVRCTLLPGSTKRPWRKPANLIRQKPQGLPIFVCNSNPRIFHKLLYYFFFCDFCIKFQVIPDTMHILRIQFHCTRKYI